MWINTEVSFPNRAVILTHSERDLHDRHVQALNMISLEPSQKQQWLSGIESAVRAVIDREYPEFSGCSIFGMRLDTVSLQWQFTIAHPNAPVVHCGDKTPMLPLFKKTSEQVERA